MKKLLFSNVGPKIENRGQCLHHTKHNSYPKQKFLANTAMSVCVQFEREFCHEHKTVNQYVWRVSDPKIECCSFTMKLAN